MTIRVGVIGTGWWATRAHLPALAADPDAEIVAIADPGRVNRERAAERFRVGRTFSSAEQMLAEVIIDAAVVATPHAEHARLAKLCLQHGSHVLLEKPMTIDPADAVDLVALARRVGREIIVGYPWHYNPQLLRIRTLLRGGRVGRVEAITCVFASVVRELYRGQPESYRDVLGFTLNSPRPETYSDPAVAGGGQGQTQVTHAAALLHFLTGLEPIEVGAFMANHELEVDLVDAAVVRFDGGALATLASTGSVLPGQEEILECRIFGERGHVCLDVMAGTASIHGADGAVERLPVVPPGDRYPEAAPVRNLVALAAGREMNGSTGQDGAITVAIIDAMYRSARLGTFVSVARAPSHEPSARPRRTGRDQRSHG